MIVCGQAIYATFLMSLAKYADHNSTQPPLISFATSLRLQAALLPFALFYLARSASSSAVS